MCSCPLQADYFGFSVLSQTFNMLHLQTICVKQTTTNCQSACPCWNFSTVNSILRDFCKNKKKEDKKREQKHFNVLYIWKYTSEYWKKNDMLTNLWQNILCGAQFLKLQYFWFLKQEKKIYQKDFNMSALHRIRGQWKQKTHKVHAAKFYSADMLRSAAN